MENNVFNELTVVKRSGQRVPFNGPKIAVAIKKAYDSVYFDSDEDAINKTYNKVLNYIGNNYIDRKTINVEDIQDIIENILKEEKHIEVYESFNSYRIKRKAFREVLERKQQHKFIKASEKLSLLIQNENKNPIGLIMNFSKTISEEYAKSYLIDSKYIRAHDEGNIYIHDLNYYIFGTTSSTHLDFSNINDYENFFEKITNILLNVKKEQHGEHSITSFDFILEPWIIYEFKKIFKRNLSSFFELEGFNKYINLNPINNIIDKLTTIFFISNIFNNYIHNNRVKIIFENAYNVSLLELKKRLESKLSKFIKCLNSCDFKLNPDYNYSLSLGTNESKEGKLINEIYFKVIERLERLENITTVYKIGVNKNNLLLENIAKLILLNKNIVFSNINASFNKKYLIKNNYKTEVEYFSNGERILENILEKNQTSTGRITVAKTSINLVRIALKSGNIKDFYKELDIYLDLAKNELLQTFEYICGKSKNDFKYLFNSNVLIENDKLEENQKIRKIIRNGTLNIGYAGLKECVYILSNKNYETITLDDLKIGIDILKYLKEKCDSFSQEFKLNFMIFETYEPNILKYFESIDSSIYGNVIKETEYTPFYKIFNNLKIDFIDRLKYESKIQKYSNGGYYEVINIPKNYSNKKILEIINMMLDNDIGFMKIKIGKQE